MASYNIKELIATKQEADVLDEGQIKWLVKEKVDKNIHDAQIGALLMAIYLQDKLTEAATGGVLLKRCTCNFIKKESPTKVFSCTFFTENFCTTASELKCLKGSCSGLF